MQPVALYFWPLHCPPPLPWPPSGDGDAATELHRRAAGTTLHVGGREARARGLLEAASKRGSPEGNWVQSDVALVVVG